MAELKGAQVVAKILKEEGVEWLAGIHGGSTFELLKATDEQNIKMLHLRDEQTGAYMADGWGRVTGRPGVCFAHCGMGMINLVSGILNAYLCRAPVVAIVGHHAISQDGMLVGQEGYAENICGTFTKWTKRIIDWRTISYFVQKAFRDAVAYPPGPVVIAMPREISPMLGEEKTQISYLPKERSAELSKVPGNPVMVEKAVHLLLEAERPIVVAGEGVYWSKASEELKEFVELLRIPVHTRRMGRGAVPEDHPLSYRGEYGRPLHHRADVMAGFGIYMGRGENFGQPPTYSPNAKYILVSESTEDLNARIPTEVRIQGDPKLVLRQMIDCARDMMKTPPARSEWLETLTKAKEAYQQRLREQAEQVRNDKPINPFFLAQEVADFLDDSATIVLDSYFMAHFISPRIIARFAGQVMDAGGSMGVGHGVGMAMGAQLARPGKQVLATMGDGGFGIGGFDLESAARYKIPAVFVLFNNSGWLNNELQEPGYKGRLALPIKDSWGMLPNIRYDKMFAEMGCHTEFVTEPEQIRPALERSFNSGKPALINVIPDTKVIPPFLLRGLGTGGF